MITHLPGGLLAEKFGGKWTLGLGLLLTSVATALTPLAVDVGGAVGLFIIRVIEGFGEVSIGMIFYSYLNIVILYFNICKPGYVRRSMKAR